MVRGVANFRERFRGFEEQYVIIGGTACDLIMEEEEMSFRATKDIDLVLIVEALTAEFGGQFWDFIKDAGYYDIYRLGQLLGAERKTLSDEIKEDMTVFLDKFEKEHVDLKAIDVRGITKEQIIQRMRHCYGIGDI